ncbi:MAG: protein kinase [Proteobacteria bacterium]|nr:protein kinase [Pseudomonadota bacterium]
MALPSLPPEAPAPGAAAPPPKVPGYRTLKRLGEGGMAAVYLATQESLDRPVAIKVMEAGGLQDEVSKQRFENEARTIAQISHPCIVAIYEVGRTGDGRMYYIMPYLGNGDLSQRDLRDDEGGIVRVLRALLSALEYAHQRGIVHRDVKAANVLFDVADRPLLTDFGIALSKRDTSRITTAGLAVGSSGYMAPEQARGDVVDGRADLYSVGVLTYELLTGHLPYQAPDALALALMHAQSPIPSLPTNKRHWQFFIDKAMAKDPGQRFRDARQMLDATQRIERRARQRFGASLLGGDNTATRRAGWKQPLALAGAAIALAGGALFLARQHLPWPRTSTEAADATDRPGGALARPHHAPRTSDATAHASPSNFAPSAPPTSSRPVAIVSSNRPTTAVASPSLAPDTAVLSAAREAIRSGDLTAPADGNAVDLSRMAWKLSPESESTRTLAADTLKALANREAQSIVEHHDPRVLDDRLKSLQLADATIGRDAPVWREVRAILAGALDRRVQAESSIADKNALRRTEALARQIDLADVYKRSLAMAANQADAAKATANLDAQVAALGTAWVVLPRATPKAPVTALARGQVTRHEYADFVNATRRPASACSGSKPVPASGRKIWSDPGFAVTSGQPVVCVSWSDANAYTQWLGAQKGQHYRLATAADWKAAKAQGNLDAAHAEWLLDRSVAGRGAGTLDGATGFDDVGFRVVRVFDPPRR